MMPKDTNGVELEVGDRVLDEIFGTGTVVGMVPLTKGVGLNVLVRWDSGHEAAKGGRSSEHMKKISTTPTASTPRRQKTCASAPSCTPPSRQSPRLQEMRQGGRSGEKSTATAVVLDRVQSQEASFMVNFFGRETIRPAVRATATVLKPSAAASSTTSTSKKRRATEDLQLPDLAPHERVRVQKLKTNYKRQVIETGDDGASEVSDDAPDGEDAAKKKPRSERGPNKAGRITKQSHVALAKRLRDFPDQALKISAGELCFACSESISSYATVLSYSQASSFAVAALKRSQIFDHPFAFTSIPLSTKLH